MIEVEVMSQHYTGKLLLEPVNKNYSLFSVYLGDEFLGHIQPVKLKDCVHWYSHEITDKELLAQIGEWVEFHFKLTDNSFKKIFSFRILPKFLGGLFAFTILAVQTTSQEFKEKSYTLIPSTDIQQKVLK